MTITVDMVTLALKELDAFIGTTYGGLMGSFGGFARTITATYVAIVGYIVLMGKAGEKTKDWALSLVLLPVLEGMIFEPDLYASWVVEPFRDTMFSLGALVAQAGDTNGLASVFDRIDEAIGRTLHAVDEVDVDGNIFTEAGTMAKVFVASVVLVVAFIFVYLAFTVIFIQALFGMYAMFLAGGIALFFAIFRETRFITWTWLRQLLNYTLWGVFVCAVMGIGVQGIEGAAKDLAEWNPNKDGVFTKEYGLALLWVVMLGYAMLKTGDYSAALTGGTAPQAGGLVGTGAMIAGGAMLGGARSLHNAVGGWAGMGKGAMTLGRGAAGLAARAWSAMRGFKTN